MLSKQCFVATEKMPQGIVSFRPGLSPSDGVVCMLILGICFATDDVNMMGLARRPLLESLSLPGTFPSLRLFPETMENPSYNEQLYLLG